MMTTDLNAILSSIFPLLSCLLSLQCYCPFPHLCPWPWPRPRPHSLPMILLSSSSLFFAYLLFFLFSSLFFSFLLFSSLLFPSNFFSSPFFCFLLFSFVFFCSLFFSIMQPYSSWINKIRKNEQLSNIFRTLLYISLCRRMFQYDNISCMSSITNTS